MKKLVPLILSAALSACSTMQPPRYSVSVDNIQELKKYENAELMISEFTQSAKFSANCRLMGSIAPADGLTIPQFIEKAINDELKMANIYSEKGTKIAGDVTNISFSSVSDLTSGFWDISIQLSSENGNTINVSNKYEFESGFDAVTACNATADALSPAVQDLIKAVITNPKFKSLF